MPNSERGGSSEQQRRQANRATRTAADRVQRNPGLKDRRAAGRPSSMPRQANRATRTAADRVQRNPGLKDRRAAVRTSSTSKQANRAIKIADDFRGRFVRPLSSPIRLSAPGA